MSDNPPPLNRHPFFRPLWRRLLVVGVAFGWAAFELITGSPGWAIMFGAMGVYAAWQFFAVWQDGPD